MAATALEVFILRYVIQISKLNAVVALNKYNATNVMHFLFSLLRSNASYMFQDTISTPILLAAN
jgi:hypothetical protein